MGSGAWPDDYRPMSEAYSAELDGAYLRLTDKLEGRGRPGRLLLEWANWVFAGDPVSAAEKPESFPALLGPYWVDPMAPEGLGPAVHSALAYSTMCGYLFIRFIDNTVDDDAPAPRELLPMLAVLHREFERPYHDFFATGHPFWRLFDDVWGMTANAASQDALSTEIDARTFLAESARKSVAALIPIAAACHLAGSADDIPQWKTLIYRLSRWHQFHTDLLHWKKDLAHGNATFFLSRGAGHKRADESLELWVQREGYGWAVGVARRWYGALLRAAHEIPSDAARSYMVHRFEVVSGQYAEMRRHQEAVLGLMRSARRDAHR